MKRISGGCFRAFSFLFLLLQVYSLQAQETERMYVPYIKTAQLFAYGNQQGLPVLSLNRNNRIELEFDDMEGNVKNYYYTYVLCDYNWRPVNLNAFDYIKGFTQNRISTYRYSSIAFTRYTHYQAILPERNCEPVKSGNYILKVYLDGDTTRLVFTKRMFVVDQKATVSAEVVQPFTPRFFSTHQKLRFSADIKSINSFSAAQQVKAVILQNNRSDIAQKDIVPTFVRGSVLEFNSENIAIFPGGKEWRWLDLRSLRLQSDRVDTGIYTKNSTEFFLVTDIDRTGQRYVYFPDYNGMFNIITYEALNPFWQGDYATVNFSFARPDASAYPDADIYLAGHFTGYQLTDEWKMRYDPETGKYRLKTFMKQGYYNYTYIAVNKNDPAQRTELEGNYWETENMYTILFYYRSFTDRYDQLIGITSINSRNDRPGFSF